MQMTALTEKTKNQAEKLKVEWSKTVCYNFPETIEKVDELGYEYTELEIPEARISDYIKFLTEFLDKHKQDSIVYMEDGFISVYAQHEKEEEEVQKLIAKKLKSKEKNKITAIKRKETQIKNAAIQAKKLEEKLILLKQKAGMI